MYIPFDQLTPDARLWVYQADRTLTTDEVAQIDNALRPVLTNWAAHGHPLLAGAQVVDNRFLLLAVDETAGLPSGCSIDSSVQAVRAIGQTIGVDFMDRAVTYLADDAAGQFVQSLPLTELKSAFATGLLTPETLIINTLVKTKAEYLSAWHVPAAQSWLKRYIKPVTA